MSLGTAKQDEAQFGLEAASPLNLVALAAKGDGDGEQPIRVLAEAEEICTVRLAQLAAISLPLSLSLALSQAAISGERVCLGRKVMGQKLGP